MSSDLCEVIITAPDPDWLVEFSRGLVNDRLCASAHNFAEIRSLYRWQGQVYDRPALEQPGRHQLAVPTR